ncbi:MAG: aminoacyl--tRNA ligase-related protein [Acidimicrobiales bacterium]
MSEDAIPDDQIIIKWKEFDYDLRSDGANQSASSRIVHPRENRVDFGWITSALQRAGILQLSGLPSAGSHILLPLGTRILRIFSKIVREEYEKSGLEEFDYPVIAGAEIYEPTRQLLDLNERILYAARWKDWGTGHRRTVLNPTGEAIIYSHWSSQIKGPETLPVRMYRRTTYFRPVTSGARVALWHGMESPDVFEFHEAHAYEAQALASLQEGLAMLHRVEDRLGLPVIWSIRPPWTNNGSISNRSFGGDVVLPVSATTQVSCIYDQGQKFSKPYDVKWRDRGSSEYVYQICGALTRRMMLSLLVMALRVDGSILLPPVFAPVQVGIVVSGTGSDVEFAISLQRQLLESGIRVEMSLPETRNRLTQRVSSWKQGGVPIVAMIVSDRVQLVRRVVLIDNESVTEESVHEPDVSETALSIQRRLEVIAQSILRQLRRNARAEVCETIEKCRETLSERQLIVTPMVPTRNATELVGSWRQGEVLGFVKASSDESCVVTGERTAIRALISPRT